jgi:hypothetical protein
VLVAEVERWLLVVVAIVGEDTGGEGDSLNEVFEV